MRIKRVRIVNHNVLQDFMLEFVPSEMTDNQRSYTLDLLVGVNGTGKSTLLRSLALIFQSLNERTWTPAFGFEIMYEMNSSAAPLEISVRNIDKTDKLLSQGSLYWSPQDEAGEAETSTDNEGASSSGKVGNLASFPRNYVPDWIVALTSGSERGWQWQKTPTSSTDGENTTLLPRYDAPDLATQLQNLFLREVPGSPVQVEKASRGADERFLFISSNITSLVVLCGLLNDMARSTAIMQEVLHASQIKALRGFSLKLRMNKELLDVDQRRFIRQLLDLAHHTIQTGSEYLLVFSLKVAEEDTTQSVIDDRTFYAQELLSEFGDGLGLFHGLLRLGNPDKDLDPILREVHLFLESDRKITDQGEAQGNVKAALYLFNWLSDGEQSFLGRLYLFSMLSSPLPTSTPQEALILLDEPEVHFNDYWKRKLIFTLNQALQGQSSHVIMTTHSSITLSDVSDQDIWVLKREADNRSYAIRPALKTLGTDPSDILVYIFGAEDAVGAQSVAFIRSTLDEIRRMPTGTAMQKQEKRNKLIGLRDRLGPSYWRYLVRRELLEEEDSQNVSSS